MSSAKLFTPFQVGKLKLANRIVIAPMCQYSAVNGCMTDWHLIHLGHLALSGAALLTIEATAVLPEARITYADVGLWNDATEAAMRPDRWRACGAGPTCRSPCSSRTPVARPRRELPWKGGGADRIRACRRLADGRAVGDRVPGRRESAVALDRRRPRTSP